MLIGMLFCSPISAGFALLGSFVSTLTALGLGASADSVYAGLWGFSATLTAIAIGGMFFVMNTWSAFFYTIASCVFTSIMHGATASFMAPFGLPGFTFPFNSIAWLFCLAGPIIGIVTPVDMAKMSRAEEHIKRYRLIEKLINIA